MTLRFSQKALAAQCLLHEEPEVRKGVFATSPRKVSPRNVKDRRVRAAVIGTGTSPGAHTSRALRARRGGRDEVVAAVDIDEDRRREFCGEAGVPHPTPISTGCSRAAPRPGQRLHPADASPRPDRRRPACRGVGVVREAAVPHARRLRRGGGGGGAGADGGRTRPSSSSTASAPAPGMCAACSPTGPWAGRWSPTARPPGTATPPTTPCPGAAAGPPRAAAPPWATASTRWTCCSTCSARGARCAPWPDRLVHDVETEDVSTALVRFESGAMATVVNSVLSPDEVSRIRVDCERATRRTHPPLRPQQRRLAVTPAPGVPGNRPPPGRTSGPTCPARTRRNCGSWSRACARGDGRAAAAPTAVAAWN